MLRHFFEMNQEAALWHYFNGGYSDAAQLMTEIERLGADLENLSVLEFACGYGRLTRHLKRLCNLSSSDIHPAAVEFVGKNCGVQTHQSASNPIELKIAGQFDVVAVISLFSHLPDETFGPWLAALYQLVAPGGHLLFTTVGDAAREINPTIAVPGLDGFIFTRDSEQKDIDGGEYGNTTARPHYVGFQIGKWLPTSKLISYQPGLWWKYQDQYIVRKPASDG